ncbi:MAG: aryl-sulfate sulfotransferase [Ignavibacteria bacterium]|nr:aryl-sulfate sulfotransferase [Ignavibacteria bacterium]
MPNGNILAIVWEKRTADNFSSAFTDPNATSIWTEKIIEIQPNATSATIVWEWNAWDHLIQQADPAKSNYGIVKDHPERIAQNYSSGGSYSQTIDWIHLNSIDYNAELDQIMVSSYGFSEIWIIDHSTTTQQAASSTGGKHNKGGDLLYRWGNPLAYQRGDSTDRMLFHQHNATWIPKGYSDEGKIMIFNNGIGRPGGNYSSIDIINPQMVAKTGSYALQATKAFAPSRPVWSYKDPENFKAPNISGAQRLPNGNTLICNGPYGHFFEITPQKKVVWQYKSPVWHTGVATQGTTIMGNFVFRCTLYPPEYSAFTGKKLIGSEPIELNAEATNSQQPLRSVRNGIGLQ